MKALIVDDSQIMRRIIVSVLKKAGVNDIAEVSNGQEADRKSTRLNSSHIQKSRMPSSA